MAQQQSKSAEKKSEEKNSGEKKKVKQLGDFRLEKKLGQGGMGTVYLATQVSLDRKVALKTLSPELAKNETFVKRFLRESRSMAKLQHQNVVQVYAADSFKNIYFAALEFVDGCSMQDWQKKLGKLSVGDALHVVMVAADALRHAHSLNMIHRDVKPDNILVTAKGMVKVADFGLAKALDDEDMSMTQTGTGLGTPLYMAPEQARNAKHVDQRSDIYALGCTLYHFLTGALPFTGNDTLEVIMAKEKGTFKSARKLNPEVPERLDLMIDKMLAKDPNLRYADCDAVIKDLAGLNLDNPSLDFIDSPDKAVRSASAGTSSSARTKAGGKTLSQAESLAKTMVQDVAGTQPEMEAVWYVRYNDKAGTTKISKFNPDQVKRGIRGGLLDLKARARRGKSGEFLPLAQYPEFEELMSGLAVRKTAEKKGRNLKDTFAELDRQHKNRHRWRWLKNLFAGGKGLVSLVIYLAVIGGVGYGAWLAYKHFTAQ